jgi:hypothetical protein
LSEALEVVGAILYRRINGRNGKGLVISSLEKTLRTFVQSESEHVV